MTEADQSIQERYLADLRCFGCGPANPRGLKLRSFESTEGDVHAVFRPWPEHDNGLGYLNGGIIATVLDCHSAAAVVVAARDLGVEPQGGLQYVTAGIDVRYRRPAPLSDQVRLLAHPISVDEGTILVDAELWWDDKVRATAHATWKRWRPRA